MTERELAWAAGVFDGDGSVCGYVPRRRHARTVQVTVYQATTPVLERFRRAMDGHGGIYGPYRGRLYHWTTKRHDAVTLVCRRLWPRLSSEKRAQMRAAVAGHSLFEPLLGAVASDLDPSLEVAWAAGFFDAEGSVTLSEHRTPSLEVPQAEVDGRPSSCLVRFHKIVGVGRLSGPRVVPSPWSRLPQYRWVAASLTDVRTVAEILAPMLGPEKRSQIRSALAEHRARRRS
jgi:hypothetical protein